MKCGVKIDQSHDDAIVGERCQTGSSLLPRVAEDSSADFACKTISNLRNPVSADSIIAPPRARSAASAAIDNVPVRYRTVASRIRRTR
jgi:hypothetical protein